MAVTPEKFFETQNTPSQVKSAIVSNYSGAWTAIMIKRAGKRIIGYADLFAGRGRFDDGSESTPILIVRKAVNDPTLGSVLKTFFNDQNADEIAALQREIGSLTRINGLAYAPMFHSEVVGLQIARRLSEFRSIPTLLFADPFGYMGISLELIELLLENQKSEALIFFNTNRINAGLSNELVRKHIDALFGARRAEAVRAKIAGLHGDDRERVVLDSFQDGLKDIGFKYVLRFRFLSRSADRTSHHLIHCSRHQLAEKIMKDVMDRYSVRSFDGVPLFQAPHHDFGQRLLFEQPLPPVDLAGELLRSFAGKTFTLPEVIRRHSPGRSYVERNYRAALSYLVEQGKVTCEPPAETMRFRQGKRIWPKGTHYVPGRIKGSAMGLKSAIEWTEATWNPVTGCDKISPGCKNCYAERMALRLRAMGQPNYVNGFELTLHEGALDLRGCPKLR
jgi:three-Cys-motif partner protein